MSIPLFRILSEKDISPDKGLIKPNIDLSKVVLPPPLGPIIPIKSFSEISSVTFSRTIFELRATVKLLIFIRGSNASGS